jgi:hypothetical protein
MLKLQTDKLVNMKPEELELIPGVKMEPLFSDEEYQAFRERFIEAMTPKLEEIQLKRIRNEHESHNRPVGAQASHCVVPFFISKKPPLEANSQLPLKAYSRTRF